MGFWRRVWAYWLQFASWLYPYCHRAWVFIRRFNHRYQVVRWAIVLFLTVAVAASAFFTYKAKTADVENLKTNLKTVTQIYDTHNEKAGTITNKGTFVELNQISPQIRNAVISTEDRSFYSNPGFDIKGLARAAVSYVIHHGQISGGGSTITQQLAKNTLLTQKQTFVRKFQEIFLAVEITRHYSKDDILTMYLNNAYFGNGVWGVEDASERYFGKHAKDLDASQGAALAAILRSPSFYNPVDHMDNALGRRNLILSLMVDNGKLTQAEANSAKNEQLTLVNNYQQSDEYRYPYFFDAVLDEAYNKYDIKEEDILNKGYKIYTTLDQTIQSQMQGSFKEDWAFPANAADGTPVQAASVAVDPNTGGVLGVIGGRGKHVFRGYNRATQMRRQPGSAMKPLAIYTPAIEAGYHPDSMLEDKLQSFGKNKYTPHNVDEQYAGEVPMYEALAESKNTAAVWLLNQIGVQKGVASAERFGINIPKSDQNLAFGIGGLSQGVSPLQMARAYSAFANGGKLPDTHFITKIVDATGAVVVDNTNTTAKQIITAKTANEMTSMMLSVFSSGTGTSAAPSGYKIAGKTGSTEGDSSWGFGTKDQWVVGYTPDVTVATWVGFDQTDANHFLKGISEQGVAPIFKQEMQNILPNTKQTPFKVQDAAQEDAANNGGSTGTSSGSGDDWLNDFQSNVEKGINGLKDKASEWYNSLKGLFQ
ncbi:PBP1A family penicillin-binding protein [Schleiferilactobacillus harbinensis]|jgi:penicillin-binding protein 2A|uniref:PBP1A family penicillin-binding protein n=1 Tax=Schleiferilactobacillus harbinensis TaxID=304207 RepID=A0A5P2TRQ5_9LACO|nr:PBP1A family penicillin-binding protein [Schleiferilactobacillus harbinensis]MBO3090508.1 PBP1A family penicillin-binding protein [Schleiferilactobacillus harbinensis]QEU46319.1 PBP1A family penicillin-binding protein [Schleiferilactobacillus harbinensis]QFR23170.1 PBP1A family penicillin-binding protein [Schleiferilactobacillus harbinensis]QFR64630.1 PBP1A family penicillin-binding protein [Schleiferilactobacillus harbinensis]